MAKKDSDDIRIAIAEIRKDLQFINNNMAKGFEGVYARQDTTNGKVLKNAADIVEINKDVAKKLNKETYNADVNESKTKTIQSLSARQVWFLKSVGALLFSILLLWLGTLIA